MAPTSSVVSATFAEASARLEVKVKAFDGKSFCIDELSGATSVHELKDLCSVKFGVAAIHQCLFFKSKELADNLTLSDAGLVNGSCLFLKKAQSWSKEMKQAPAGTVPCASGCGGFGTSRTDNFCSQCFARRPCDDRSRLWNGIFLEEEAANTDQESTQSVEDGCESTPLTVGMAVTIYGLHGAKDLNGRRGWIVKYMDDRARFIVKLKGEEGTKAVKGRNLKRLKHVKPVSASKLIVQKDKTKCWACSRRCGLTGFECRCGYVFCSMHRHAEDHQCDFDHHKFGQEIISKCNPKLQVKWELLDGL